MNDPATAMDNELQRRREIMEKIRCGLEMDVELCSEIYSPDRPLPVGSPWLRFWLSVHRLDFPLLTFFSAGMIKRFLPSAQCRFVAGFRCVVGNIVCDEASLFETCFVDYATIYVGRGTGFSYRNLVITSEHDPADMKTVFAREIVIGAGSVVSRNISPNIFAAGAPARPIELDSCG